MNFSGFNPDGSPYEPGTRFAIYRSTIRGYMDRWIVRTPWFQIRLHHILRYDMEGDLHDHPFAFVSLILRGGYREERRRYIGSGAAAATHEDFGKPEYNVFYAGSIVTCGARDVHTLFDVLPETWTLVLATGRSKGWGFLTDDRGMVPWHQYFQGNAKQ